MVSKEKLKKWLDELGRTDLKNEYVRSVYVDIVNELRSLPNESTPPLFNPIFLEEGVDFTWEEKENGYGFTHVYPKLNDGTLLSRIVAPHRNSIVLMKKDNRLIPVVIHNGQYEVNGRISNTWTWQQINEDLTLGEKTGGYGGFFKSHLPLEIKQELLVRVLETNTQ